MFVKKFSFDQDVSLFTRGWIIALGLNYMGGDVRAQFIMYERSAWLQCRFQIHNDIHGFVVHLDRG